MSKVLDQLLSSCYDDHIDAPDVIKEVTLAFCNMQLSDFEPTRQSIPGHSNIDYIKRTLVAGFDFDQLKLNNMTVGELIYMLFSVTNNTNDYFYSDSDQCPIRCSYCEDLEELKHVIFPSYIGIHFLRGMLLAAQTYNLERFFNISFTSFLTECSKSYPDQKSITKAKNMMLNTITKSRAYNRLKRENDEIENFTLEDIIHIIQEESTRPYCPGLEHSIHYIDMSASIQLMAFDLFFKNIYQFCHLNEFNYKDILEKYKNDCPSDQDMDWI